MRVEKKIKIDKFDNFDGAGVQVDKFYNCKIKDNLKGTVGIDIAKFPTDMDSTEYACMNIKSGDLKTVEGVVFFKQDNLETSFIPHMIMIYGDDKKLYINQMFMGDMDLYWLFDLKFEKAPISIMYKKDDADAMILASENLMKVWRAGYSPYVIEDSPIITSMCMNDGVLFCTVQKPAFKIWYATDLDAENVGKMSSVSNYISLEDDLGDARKVVSFDESVYAFRDYGITKISFIKNEIVTSQVYQSNTKIFADTVSVCGGQILFMTQYGLFSFNGVKVVKISIDLLGSFELKNSTMTASSLGEKYYLALNLNYNDDNNILCENGNCVNNTLMIVDTNNYSYELIRGVDCKSLLPVKSKYFEKMLVIFGSGYNYQLGEIVSDSIYVEDNLPKFWCSKNVNEDNGVKMFSRLSVVAEKGVEIKLITETGVYSFVSYLSGLNEFNFKIVCKQLKVQILSKNKTSWIENVELNYYDY